MQEVTRALDEVRALYEKVLGSPAPELDPGRFVAFPPGVDPLQHALREVDLLKQISRQATFAPAPVAWIPPADVLAADDALIVRVDVPGVSRETLKVLVLGGECVIRGERTGPAERHELRPLSLERSWGPFERRFALPAGCHPDKITARYAEGVLELRIVAENRGTPKEMKVELA